jgi:hypothetical protein
MPAIYRTYPICLTHCGLGEDRFGAPVGFADNGTLGLSLLLGLNKLPGPGRFV